MESHWEAPKDSCVIGLICCTTMLQYCRNGTQNVFYEGHQVALIKQSNVWNFGILGHIQAIIRACCRVTLDKCT